ncbi:DUF3748 domain-containing protein [Erwinia psidii]|uniref:DUF3748 domain-containing protein n=1 Tax=Erwinia psidii TaxID=69224 RepID=A0A3N6S2I1_9GAMM|nr:DUF3748 domain-containing protein [Erwinia psidii]MCX8958420.1 DUF3748 domain-containing protein [Erwinia psidii]MCX8961069.1 DUF3748 domain-containing protein [Erwinia psidii]MCX8965502.1 DUF3748 domain-containing protein [Erwinia psidii]RQM39047.1 DUF3748 domain-containing protein [Erwinia psidii]
MTERQLTFDSRNHQLTNINVWTADSHWLVYDVRSDTATFDGLTVERVNLSGQTEVLYQAGNGAHIGVITTSSDLPPRYVFIHGPEHPDAQWQYDFHHRRGVIVQNGLAENMDACDITPPFTVGALRGGSHVHVFSPDGSRLSFTYNDHLMHQLAAEEDRRNVGVAVPLRPVCPPKSHPREYDGRFFCVLVSHTTRSPRPGSDEINRAFEEGWVGTEGYMKKDGHRQRWALAFIGDTIGIRGEKVSEVFIVDLPEKLTDYALQDDKPIEGTVDTLPAPPAGIKQRRLTFTHQRTYPGLVTTPRHWLRSSPDGRSIAFLMKDDAGVVQLWTIAPTGGQPRQISHAACDIQSAFSWHPDGQSVALINDNSVMLCETGSGNMRRLTARTNTPPVADAVVCSPDGKYVAYMRCVNGFRQIFIADVLGD